MRYTFTVDSKDSPAIFMALTELADRYEADRMLDHEYLVRELRADLAGQRDAQEAAPLDHILVPVEATQAMIDAAMEDERQWRRMPNNDVRIRLHWDAMIQALLDRDGK